MRNSQVVNLRGAHFVPLKRLMLSPTSLKFNTFSKPLCDIAPCIQGQDLENCRFVAFSCRFISHALLQKQGFVPSWMRGKGVRMVICDRHGPYTQSFSIGSKIRVHGRLWSTFLMERLEGRFRVLCFTLNSTTVHRMIP